MPSAVRLLGGELDGVGEEVEDHLAHPQRIAPHPQGHVALHARVQLASKIAATDRGGSRLSVGEKHSETSQQREWHRSLCLTAVTVVQYMHCHYQSSLSLSLSLPL